MITWKLSVSVSTCENIAVLADSALPIRSNLLVLSIDVTDVFVVLKFALLVAASSFGHQDIDHKLPLPLYASIKVSTYVDEF